MSKCKKDIFDNINYFIAIAFIDSDHLLHITLLNI